MTTNKQGLPQQPTEVDGIPSAPLSDGSQLGTDESEASRGKAGGDQETIGGRGEGDVTLTATVSNEQGGDEGVASAASEPGGDEGVASTASEPGGESVSSAARSGSINWNSLGEAKRRFNFDILPKVCSNLPITTIILECFLVKQNFLLHSDKTFYEKIVYLY